MVDAMTDDMIKAAVSICGGCRNNPERQMPSDYLESMLGDGAWLPACKKYAKAAEIISQRPDGCALSVELAACNEVFAAEIASVLRSYYLVFDYRRKGTSDCKQRYFVLVNYTSPQSIRGISYTPSLQAKDKQATWRFHNKPASFKRKYMEVIIEGDENAAYDAYCQYFRECKLRRAKEDVEAAQAGLRKAKQELLASKRRYCAAKMNYGDKACHES